MPYVAISSCQIFSRVFVSALQLGAGNDYKTIDEISECDEAVLKGRILRQQPSVHPTPLISQPSSESAGNHPGKKAPSEPAGCFYVLHNHGRLVGTKR
jgi:hypothetical protein